MNESKPWRQSKRMMGIHHAGRVRLKLSVSRPTGSWFRNCSAAPKPNYSTA
jgi:hypothetical protein